MLAKSSNGNKLGDITRRGFLKAITALGASAALYGCGSDSGGDPSEGGITRIPKPILDTEDYHYVMGGHNCGTSGGCISKAWVKNGRVIRVTSVAGEAPAGYDYNADYSNSQQRPCGRCRGNRYRIAHPGRLKYPLKQTKLRGDLSGFVRMSWDDAMDEITRKHKAIISKYGPESIYSLYACGAYTSLQGGGYTGIWNARGGACVPLNYVGGAAQYSGDYSYHQRYNWSDSYTGYSGGNAPSAANLAAGSVKNLISFGDNSMTTRHNTKNAQVSAYAAAKAAGTNIIFIAPEFVDMGVNIATEFIPTKPYTTAALLAGMLHEMLINTFNADGTVRPGTPGSDKMNAPWLDVEYLDLAVYGFFDSPKYWLRTSGTAGQISLTPQSGWREVNAVPPGMSYSAWIMGDEGQGTNRLMKARYDAAKNYIANTFASEQTFRNAALCSQEVAQGTNTAYQRKKEYNVPKTAEWASKITGIPVQRIKDLAWMYCDPTQHPIYHTHGFGLEKQLDGIFHRFALNAFFIITKTYGQACHGMGFGTNGLVSAVGGSAPTGREAMPSLSTSGRPSSPGTAGSGPTAPNLSVAQWHNAIRMAFMDVMLDPAKGPVYTAKHIPDYKPTVDFKTEAESKNLSTWKSYVGRVYNDEGGAKALVKLDRAASTTAGRIYSGAPKTESGTNYYEYVSENGKPVYSGYRWIINSGGNILMNQHMNPGDTAEMLESIPSCGQTNNPDDPDDLCIISFDPFLSPSPRWSDYVLPAKTMWEQVNQHSAGGQTVLMTELISQSPGDSIDSFDLATKFCAAYEKIDASLTGLANQWTIIEGDRYMDKVKRAFENANFSASSRYYEKTFEEALKVQYAMPLPGSALTPSSASTNITGTRKTYEDFTAELRAGTKTSADICYANVSTTTSFTGYGGQYTSSTVPCPSTVSGRFHVYTEVPRWGYAKKYERWHKHLADAGLPTGQRTTDIEGDPIIPLIPMYLNYEDSFMEAYGGPARMAEMPEDKRFLVTTTHTIHRAHSSVAESPLVRELTHRVRGGDEHSGNDWGTYALSDIKNGKIPRLNSAMNGSKTDFKRASWTEVLMNEDDGARLGIQSGDIIEMRNPVGAVRVSVKLTKRAAKGYIALNQGAWYDPDPVDGVDDGGCANTIMCTKGSRLDHGNGQQSAMVSIKKVY